MIETTEQSNVSRQYSDRVAEKAIRRMQLKQMKEDHENLVSFMYEYAERHSKKDGHWMIFRLNDDWFIQMDSWNKHIELKQGSGDYEYWCGFKGKKWLYLGGDWGGFSEPTNPKCTIAVLNRAKTWMATKPFNIKTIN